MEHTQINGIEESIEILYWERSPPWSLLSTAISRNIKTSLKPYHKSESEDKPISIQLKSNNEIFYNNTALKYFSLIGSGQYLSFENLNPIEQCQIDQWLEYSINIVNSAKLVHILKDIDNYLSLRTYFVGNGNTLTIADLCIWNQLKNSTLWTKIKSSGELTNLIRWYNHISNFPGCIEADKILNKTNDNKNNTSNATENKDTGSFEINLPNAIKGKVVTRFPPEPSGYLHIGHAKALLINHEIAKRYEGKMIVRFDDTNPSKEKDDFVESILKDIRDLNVKYDRITYTSDYFDAILEMGEKMIKAGNMYGDNTGVEEMRQERGEGIESKCRNQTKEENLEIWKKMIDGTSPEDKAYCMRIKMDMKAANKALRDPVAFRCNDTAHWKTGTKYKVNFNLKNKVNYEIIKVYPTYDFACPYVDSHEGVTHAMRTSEYKDREAQYNWILKLMREIDEKLPNVEIWEYSRLNFVNTVLSKRKLQWFVNTKRVDGWDDPRFPTVQGILRRGLTIEALREFILLQGASKNITFQEWDKIWTMNKKILDPITARHTAIDVKDKVKINLMNGPEEIINETVLKHKKNPNLGKKLLVKSSKILIDQIDAKNIKDGEEITLMDWGNCIIQDKIKNKDVIECINAKLYLEGDFKKTKWKLTWLSDSDDLVKLKLIYFDFLITKSKLDENDDFEKFVNEKTKEEVEALGDPNMRILNKGDKIQLERKGYFIVDQPYFKKDDPIILFNIPDGRQKK